MLLKVIHLNPRLLHRIKRCFFHCQAPKKTPNIVYFLMFYFTIVWCYDPCWMSNILFINSHKTPAVSPLAANEVEVDSLEQRRLIACERCNNTRLQKLSLVLRQTTVAKLKCWWLNRTIHYHLWFSCLSESVKVKVLRSVLKGALCPKPKAKSVTESLFRNLAMVWEFLSRRNKPIS